MSKKFTSLISILGLESNPRVGYETIYGIVSTLLVRAYKFAPKSIKYLHVSKSPCEAAIWRKLSPDCCIWMFASHSPASISSTIFAKFPFDFAVIQTNLLNFSDILGMFNPKFLDGAYTSDFLKQDPCTHAWNYLPTTKWKVYMNNIIGFFDQWIP